MARSREFVIHVLDQLGGLGAVTARSMFGGHGLYFRGTMIGLIADDVFYLKVDDGNRPDFEAAGSHPFSYRQRGRRQAVAMSYWEVPADVLEEPGALEDWAREAHAAALRSKRGPAKRVKKDRAAARAGPPGAAEPQVPRRS
jgi:DNA transformation protein